MAHRGGGDHGELQGLENTLVAFRHAVDLGYRYLETDVHVTSDGALLAFHDHELDRLTDGHGALARLPYAEVREARVGGREPIPSLAELFDEFPQARFNIDVKSPGSVPALADFIAARNAHDRALVGSFSLTRLQEFRRLTAGRVATSASPPEVAAFLMAPDARLAARLCGQFDAFQIPVRRRGVRVTTPGLIRRAHALNRHVHVWTINEVAEIETLLELGVDGFVTDRTDTLKDVLVEHGRWRASTP
ncbi:MAG: glycerophosphodiester phosphodiesterase [Nocardioides sp.]